MPRYVTRAWLPLFVESEWDGEPHRPSLTVSEHQAVGTGLITPTGEPIMRLPDPVGFHRPKGRK